MTGPPAALLRSLVDGPSPVSDVEWHDEVASTQVLAADAARRGAPEIHVVLADRQTAGRGRRGRAWEAPAGTSLLASFVLRPTVGQAGLARLPLLAGLALAEVAERYCPDVTLKWPNDLLVGGHKAAGVLAETGPVGSAVLLGVGVNVDWRGVTRPPAAAAATSFAEAAGGPVDRWRVLAGFVGLFGRRYRDWQEEPAGFLGDYRRRCATVGQRVRLSRPRGEPLDGVAEQVDDDGALLVTDREGTTHRLFAGDVEHARRA